MTLCHFEPDIHQNQPPEICIDGSRSTTCSMINLNTLWFSRDILDLPTCNLEQILDPAHEHYAFPYRKED